MGRRPFIDITERIPSHSIDYFTPTSKVTQPSKSSAKWWDMEARLTAEEVKETFGMKPATDKEIWEKVFEPMGYTKGQTRDRLENSKRLGYLEKVRIK